MSNAIAFVDTGNDWLATLLEHCGNVSVICCKTCSYVTHKYDNVCSINRNLCLKTHLLQNYIVCLWLNTARINYYELFGTPLCFTVNSVTGNTWCILNYGTTLAYQFIKKCAFADVRSADNSNYRFCHFIYLLTLCRALPIQMMHRHCPKD